MNIDFNIVVNDRCTKIRDILTHKEKEYASAGNRFHNFEVAARKRKITREQALEGMMLKHEVSVMDLVDWAATDDDRLSWKIINEKIGDNINYLILLEGMLKERTMNRGE